MFFFSKKVNIICKYNLFNYNFHTNMDIKLNKKQLFLDDEPGYFVFGYSKLKKVNNKFKYFEKSVDSLKTTIDVLENQIDNLTQQVDVLENQIDNLKNQETPQSDYPPPDYNYDSNLEGLKIDLTNRLDKIDEWKEKITVVFDKYRQLILDKLHEYYD